MRKTYHTQGGFSLIELLVVILIVGLLAAIALPIFNGQRSSAREADAKSILRNTFTTAKAFYTDRETFENINTTDLRKDFPQIDIGAPNNLTPGSDANPYYLSFNTTYGIPDIKYRHQVLMLCNASKGRYSFCIYQAYDGKVRYSKTTGNLDSAMTAAYNGTSPW